MRGGVDWLQIRDHELEGAALLALARELSRVARRAAAARNGSVRILVNRRVDVALALGADGVQLGTGAMAPADARRCLPAGASIGVSLHAPEEVPAALAAGATHAQLAPIWSPLSKPAERPALGVARLREATRFGLPILAQGGVRADRCAEAVAAGARGVAVTGDILLAGDVFAAAAALRAALDAAS